MASTTTSKKTFFDLPRELRDFIYDLTLVPEEPIELAPLSFGLPRFERSRKDQRLKPTHYEDSPTSYGTELRLGHFVGVSWHVHRYKTEIRPALKLFRVSRQVSEEARDVYYGQEFRFPSSYGWHILYEWLLVIGEANRLRLRYITVCHPAIPAMPACGKTFARGCDAVAQNDLLLSPVPNNFPLPAYREGSKRTRAKKGQQAFKQWMASTDPTATLLELHELRVLRFTLFNPHWRDDLTFEAITEHPIHKAEFSVLLKVWLAIVNLRSHRGGRDNEIMLRPRFGRAGDADSVRMRDAEADDRVEKAGAMFIAIQMQGWSMEVAKYDNHFTWPVEEKDRCVNGKICEHLRDGLRGHDRRSEEFRQAVLMECAENTNDVAALGS